MNLLVHSKKKVKQKNKNNCWKSEDMRTFERPHNWFSCSLHTPQIQYWLPVNWRHWERLSTALQKQCLKSRWISWQLGKSWWFSRVISNCIMPILNFHFLYLKRGNRLGRTPCLQLEFWIQFVSWHDPQKKKKPQGQLWYDFLHIYHNTWLHVFVQKWWNGTRDEAEFQFPVSLVYT